MNKKDWEKALVGDELVFWRRWFETKGLDWPEDFKARIDGHTEIQDWVAVYLKTGKEKILDVGSGPISVLGKMFWGKKLNITSCDALGEEYEKLKAEFGICGTERIISCKTEEISEYFKNQKFDLVFAQNCIDHSYDPIACIMAMIKVLKKNGVVLLRHERNEAENEGYKGLHQWNFDYRDGKFVIGNSSKIVEVQKYMLLENINGVVVNISTRVENNYIINEIRII